MITRILLLALLVCAAPVNSQDVLLPQPYGGNLSFKALVEAELTYPRHEFEQRVRGKVILGFSISSDGQPDNIRVLASPSEPLTKEAIRLMRFIRWEPAQHSGQAVAHNHCLSFNFHPVQYKRICRSRGYEEPPYPYHPIDSSWHIWAQDKVEIAAVPKYPGNCLSMREFIQKNMSYPPAAQKLGLSGAVALELVVEPSGRSSNIRIVKGIGGGCDEEAQRLVRLLRWVPGQRGGTYVRSEMQINITFALPEGSDYRYFPTDQGTTVQ